MRNLPLALAAAAAFLVPSAPLAQGAAPPPAGSGPVTTGLTATASFGGGAELGLEQGNKPGVLELEVAVGYETSGGVRPELGVVLGLAPDGHVGLRPGLRWAIPGVPLLLRVAADITNARDTGLRWHWVLMGVAAELRLTSLFGLYGEIDTGVPIGARSGLPLLVRGGASFRF